MRLSIVIPVYNADKYLSTCLDSLLCQDIDRNDHEILIINDGSNDNSLTIANLYSDRYKHIKIHTKENNGVGSARNKGIDIAQGKYIYFIDTDDYIISNTLNELVDTIEQSNLDILTFVSNSVVQSNLNEDKNVNNPIRSEIKSGIDYIANFNYNNEVWWYLIKRDFLKSSRIKFVEKRWMEDAIFTTELFINANAMANFSLDAHRHLIVEGSAMTSKEPNHYLKVIRDNQNAAKVFIGIIEKLKNEKANPDCIKRVKARQQSFVFFSMIRMLKSNISFDEVRILMKEMTSIKVYPLDSFLGKDYNNLSYQILVRLFNRKSIFYLTFLLFNPLFRLKLKFFE